MEKYISDFGKELHSIELNDALEKELLDKAFSKLSFYTYIPYELYRVLHLTDVGQDTITKLAVASYTYFSFVLFLDKIRDGQLDVLPQEKSLRYIYSQNYIFKVHEYVFKTLAHLYPADSGFWREFDKLKTTFLNAEDNKATESNLLNLLLRKSSLSEAYIFAFKYLMSDKDKNCNALQILNKFSEAMNNFHVAFQLYDDYNDLKEDIAHGQLNYYLFKGRELRKVFPDNEKFIKALYVSDVISDGLDIAKKYALQAESEFRALGMDIHANWSKSLSGKILNKAHYIYVLLLKTQQIAANSREVIHDNSTINKELELSLDFLKSQLEDDSWEDFLTNAGFGRNWVTGYILTQMVGNIQKPEFLQKVFDRLLRSGGRYNEYIVEDADSMNFLIKSMSLFGMKPSKEIIRKWCNFRKPNGGFSTYYKNDIKHAMNLDDSANFIGWFMPQKCVTAVACWAAAAHREMPEVQTIYETAKQFLLSNQNPEGSWSSYWWTSDIYATAFSIMALLDDPDVERSAIDHALQYIIKTQQPEGGFWESYHEPSTFFTAIAINALIQLHIQKKYGDLSQYINNGITWLRKNQYDDGSWKTARILRLPFPDELNPANIKDWRRTSFGLNCLVDDHKRVFTTATIYNTLGNYAKYCL